MHGQLCILRIAPSHVFPTGNSPGKSLNITRIDASKKMISPPRGQPDTLPPFAQGEEEKGRFGAHEKGGPYGQQSP